MESNGTRGGDKETTVVTTIHDADFAALTRSPFRAWSRPKNRVSLSSSSRMRPLKLNRPNNLLGIVT